MIKFRKVIECPICKKINARLQACEQAASVQSVLWKVRLNRKFVSEQTSKQSMKIIQEMVTEFNLSLFIKETMQWAI